LGFRAKAIHEHFNEHAHEAHDAATPNQGQRNLSSSVQHEKDIKLDREGNMPAIVLMRSA
jgi:hypothetical protein